MEFPGRSFGPPGNLGHMLKLHNDDNNDSDGQGNMTGPHIIVALDISKLINEHSFSFKFIGTIFAC